MPIYEYCCPTCKRFTNRWQADMRPPKTTKCEHCGAKAGKIVSLSSFLLRGPGWPSKELTMSEVIEGEHKRDSEFNRRRREMTADGFEFPYYDSEPKRREQ